MNNKFDELTKSMAQSVTRRAALKKFGVGLAGMALACFGLASKSKADEKTCNACRKSCLAIGNTVEYCKGLCSLVCQYKLSVS
jgi:hypothetical protein